MEEQAMRFLVLGATGMAGHVISLYLKRKGHVVITYSRKPFPYCDNFNGEIIENLSLIENKIRNYDFDAVVNCIGVLNEDAENDKSKAVYLNSYLPHYLVEKTMNKKTKVIHLSTDCVFSGNVGGYNEDSPKDGTRFYDMTKSLGEIKNKKDLTFRTSIIGPDINSNGKGLLNWFMKQETAVKGFAKAFWTGVTTTALAKAIEKAVSDNICGLYHLVNNTPIAKYDLILLFQKYNLNKDVYVDKDEKNVIDKSLLDTRNDFNFEVPSYDKMIEEMADWIKHNKELYPHYDIKRD